MMYLLSLAAKAPSIVSDTDIITLQQHAFQDGQGLMGSSYAEHPEQVWERYGNPCPHCWLQLTYELSPLKRNLQEAIASSSWLCATYGARWQSSNEQRP